MSALASLGVRVLVFATGLPLNLLFTFAWNHSLTELWPNVVPEIGYWQGYLLIVVASFIFPFRAEIINWKD